MSFWVDLTRTIEDNMPAYPGDPRAQLKNIRYFDQDGYCEYLLESNMHVGTHMDIPMHMLPSEKYVSDYPLEQFTGRGCLIDAKGESKIVLKPEYETQIQEGDIVLFYTGHEATFNTEAYYIKYPVLSEEWGDFLVQKGIKIVAMDGPSPDAFPFELHKKFFSAGICIIENLCNLEALSHVQEFEVMAFPLKIKAEASLVRVVVRVIK